MSRRPTDEASSAFLAWAQRSFDYKTSLAVRRAWKVLDINNLDATTDMFAAALVAEIEKLHGEGVDVALEHIHKVLEGAEDVTDMPAVFNPEQVVSSIIAQGPGMVKHYIKAGVAPSVAMEQGMRACHASMSRLVENSVRHTIQQTADKAGGGWGWQRHASAHACDFCLMLAGRGAVYESKKTATGHKYHDRCHCVAQFVKKGSSNENKDTGIRVEVSNSGTHGVSDTARKNRVNREEEKAKSYDGPVGKWPDRIP